MEDKILVKLIKENTEEGIKQAMILYSPLVKAIVIKLMGRDHPEDIKECMADVFIKLWRFIENFDEKKGSLKGYIAIIARNETLRNLKKKGRYPKCVDENEVEMSIEVDMVSEIGKKINVQIVQEAVDELPEPDRQIFISRYFWGKRVKEISTQMALEEKFIENRLYLVKKNLKKNLLSKGVVL
ncbi:MAG: RNA polymerase sigma factor [Cellulosilyticaceae bacterium]